MENIYIVLKLCGILAGTALINIVLGAMQAGFTESWDWKKFFYGLIKAIVLVLCIAAFCVILDFIPEVFSEAGIEISEDVVTVVQVFLVLGATIKKYALDVYEKIVEILES